MYTVIIYSKIDHSILFISDPICDFYHALKWAEARKAPNNYYEITED